MIDDESLLSSELPPPHEEEPAELRQDILDELADHLACSYRKELLAGADAASARQRVLERFGDPANVAARLWFDAMKGKIMSQRILTVLNLVFLVALVGVLGVIVFQMKRSQAQLYRSQAELQIASGESRRAVQALIDKNQTAQETLLAEFKAAIHANQAQQSANARNSDWIPLKLKFTKGRLGGPPVVGVYAALFRGINEVPVEKQRESDAGGVVDFGVIQPGDWRLELAYSNDGTTWNQRHFLNVALGGPIEKTIICPEAIRIQPVEIQVQWPPNLAKRGLMAMANLVYVGTNLQPEFRWNSQFSNQDQFKTIHVFLLNGDARQITDLDSPGILWTLDSLIPFDASSSRKHEKPPENPGRVFVSYDLEHSGKAMERAELIEGHYRLVELEILRPAPISNPTQSARSFEVLARTSEFLRPIHQPPVIPANHADLQKEISNLPHTLTRGLTLQRNLLGQNPQEMIVAPGQPNIWQIKIPPELAEAAEKALKSGTEEPPKPSEEPGQKK